MQLRLTLILFAACLPAMARAEWGASTTTIVRAFDVLHTLDVDDVQRVRSYRPVDQYLRLSWDELGERGAWTFDATLRGRWDFGTGRTAEPASTSPVADDDEDDLDVLFAHAAWRSKGGLVGLRLGRQQTVTGAGWHAFDGARLDFNKHRNVKVFVHAGMPVDLADNGWPESAGFTWATGLTGMFPKHGSIGLEYEVRRIEANDARAGRRVITADETASLDAGFAWGRTRLEAHADYSLLLRELGETTLVVGRELARRHSLEARASRIVPIFSAEDIWSVFDVNAVDERRLTYEFRGDGTLDLGGYIAHENYADTDLPGPQDIRRAAATARWEGSREAVHRSELGMQRGFSGSRVSMRHDSDWGLTPRLRAGAGVSIHSYENLYRLTEQDESYALRGRLRCEPGTRWDLALEIEQHIGRNRDTLRGNLVVSMRFGNARGELPWWGGRFTGSQRRTSARAQPLGITENEEPTR